MSSFLTIFFISTLIFFKNLNSISKKLQLYDRPISKIKIHKKKVSLAGSLIFLNLLALSIFFSEAIINKNIFGTNSKFLYFLLTSVIIFLIGCYDDKFLIKPIIKFTLLGIFISILIFFDGTVKIKFIEFRYFDFILFMKNFDYIFTVFCFLLFLNAFNLFDGINLQCIAYSISILFFFIIVNGFDIFLLSLIFALVILLYFNFKNKVFLGDSGSLFLGFVISYYSIFTYEKNHFIGAEDIFLMMMIPGIDMLRLFLFRIFKKKNPFNGDNLHLHHLILNKFDQKKTFFIIFFFNTVVFYLGYFSGIVLYAILFNFLVYIISLIYLLNSKTSRRVK
jgi:UDP-GlcNAc:undecaprenyl-phosphate GlcNAc-1-phosphate transferase